VPLFLIIGGLAFGAGSVVGSAAFSFLLRQRERRVTAKFKAIEAIRVYLHKRDVPLTPWVVHVLDQERTERKALRPHSRRSAQRGFK
jgi:hypothetical protein